jgi:hypothetical protein
MMLGYNRDEEGSARRAIGLAIHAFEREIRPWIKADLILFAAGSTLFIRGRPESSLSDDKSSIAPNKKFLSRELRKKREDIGKFSRAWRHMPVAFNDCYGHLVFSVFYRIIVMYVSKKTGRPMLPKDYAKSVLIDRFMDLIQNAKEDDVYKYYYGQFSNIVCS